MKVVTEADLKAEPGTYLHEAEAGPVVVTRQGRPVAVLLAVKGSDDLESLLLGHSSELQAILERSRQQVREGKGIAHEALWKELDEQTRPSVPKQRRRRPR